MFITTERSEGYVKMAEFQKLWRKGIANVIIATVMHKQTSKQTGKQI